MIQEWHRLIVEANDQLLTEFLFTHDGYYYYSKWIKKSWSEPKRIKKNVKFKSLS